MDMTVSQFTKEIRIQCRGRRKYDPAYYGRWCWWIQGFISPGRCEKFDRDRDRNMIRVEIFSVTKIWRVGRYRRVRWVKGVKQGRKQPTVRESYRRL
ncbi:unnamed protein product [Arabis nemorensis]|uniref:Uncharacterized protein n=1 Tax=Arabis nemorensis TaxID=586526 RepID=A0A565C907_9BRAS|nr:unnamed protein product [Arabis nemorensis]